MSKLDNITQPLPLRIEPTSHVDKAIDTVAYIVLPAIWNFTTDTVPTITSESYQILREDVIPAAQKGFEITAHYTTTTILPKLQDASAFTVDVAIPQVKEIVSNTTILAFKLSYKGVSTFTYSTLIPATEFGIAFTTDFVTNKIIPFVENFLHHEVAQDDSQMYIQPAQPVGEITENTGYDLFDVVNQF